MRGLACLESSARMDNKVNSVPACDDSRTLTTMATEGGSLQGGRPSPRSSSPPSARQSPPLPHTNMTLGHHRQRQVQPYQPTASRKVSLNPAGQRDIRESSGAGFFGFCRKSNQTALEQMMRHQQSTMDFNNAMRKGNDDLASFGVADGSHLVPTLNPIHDPMIPDWEKLHLMGTGIGGGRSEYFGESLMNFSPSLLLSSTGTARKQRRGNISHVGSDADDVAAGSGAPKQCHHYPQRQQVFAREKTDHHMMLMDDRVLRPHQMGSTALPYSRLDATAGFSTETGLPSRNRVAKKLHSGTKAQQQQALILELQSRQSIKKKERAPSSTSFPVKLYNILCDPNYRDFITWLPHGRAWRILKPKAFEEDVIPKFFRSDRYASFMRQVRWWCIRYTFCS